MELFVCVWGGGGGGGVGGGAVSKVLRMANNFMIKMTKLKLLKLRIIFLLHVCVDISESFTNTRLYSVCK